MKNALLALLVWCAAATAATAQIAVLDCSGVPAGVYFYKVEVAEDGTLTFTPVTQVVTLKPTPGPGPGPTPELNADAKAVRDAALKVEGDKDRVKTALALADVYVAIAKKVKSGALTGDDIGTVAKADADKVLKERKVDAAWASFRSVVTDRWNAVLQEGGGDAELGALCDSVAAGLREAGK